MKTRTELRKDLREALRAFDKNATTETAGKVEAAKQALIEHQQRADEVRRALDDKGIGCTFVPTGTTRNRR